MTVRGHQYERRGVLAIDPKAFLEVFFCDDTPRENVEQDGCVIVDIRGPLEKDSHPWCDSYEDIVERVRQACATAARAVIMRFDSPGGDAQGCFDAADELRAMAATYGKQLHAYVDGDCCSAAYALACSAQSITISTTSLIGSVGCLSTRDDVSAMNAARGLRVALITSGARKADGHPDQPLSESELTATQGLVDSMAQVFFDLVARSRPTLTAESVAKLEAKVFHGAAAVSAGLADAVGPMSTVLARVAGVANGDLNMAATALEKARALLQEAAEGDDPNAAAAREALAKISKASGEEEPKKDEENPPPKKEEATTPEKDTDAAGEPPKPNDTESMAAAAYRAAIAAQRENAKLRAELKARDEVSERATLIAACPDLQPEMRMLLEKAPMDLVRETVASMTKDAPKNPKAAQLSRAPTRGAGQGGGDPRFPSPPQQDEAAADALATRMGLVAAKPVVVNTEYTQRLGVFQPASLGDTTKH